jgi:CarD family transcriptional regulator
MDIRVGQKVAYPGQGICRVEGMDKRDIGDDTLKVYSLRVLSDNSTIFVPMGNMEAVGIRPLINESQCRKLISMLSDDFENVSSNWKTRSKGFIEKLQTGDIFDVADVLKQLTFLSIEKRLSFREQTLLEKAKFLLVSEISNAKNGINSNIESDVVSRIEKACSKHVNGDDSKSKAATGH